MFAVDFFKVMPKLSKALQMEQNAQAVYRNIDQEIKDDRDIITEIIEEKKTYYTDLYNYYIKLTGSVPITNDDIEHKPVILLDALQKALALETNNSKFYSDAYTTMNNSDVRDLFFRGLTNSSRHAVSLNYLYTKNLS